jgi:polyferredoxin
MGVTHQGRYSKPAIQVLRSCWWVRTRKLTQYLALVGFIALFLGSRQGGWPGNIVNIPMRLDPLMALSHMLATRTLVAGSSLALITVLGTLIFGRAWCGWLCPLGTTFDLVSSHRCDTRRPTPTESWRQVKYIILLIIITAAVLGNLTLLFLDPISILLRTLTISVWPALDQVISFLEVLLHRVPILGESVAIFDTWLRPVILPLQPLSFRDEILLAAFFLLVILLDIFAFRFWCRYLCPLGALLGLLSKPALFRRRLMQECRNCVLCTRICPTGTINPVKGYSSDAGECTMCMECLEVCPSGRMTFAPTIAPIEWNEYDPNRRSTLLTMGSAIIAVALLRGKVSSRDNPSVLLRPPGVSSMKPGAEAYKECTRCGECLRACPTGGLQPAVMDAGVEGFGSPILIPRFGYCDYSCNACGQACPVEAIPPLNLEQKRLQVIGTAYIHEDRCIAWSNRTPCIVCEEMCPLPTKAIQ